MQRTLSEWLNHIGTLHHQRIDLGLERIREIADEMKVCQFTCPTIVVAGTNGKGSCIRTLESIYTHAGYRVAAYTSPHLLRFNERIRIGAKELTDEEIIAGFIAVEQTRKSRVLSFFEFTTLAALFLIKNAKPDVILLEVGLGGRLDAVNIVDADLAVIMSIALDHCDRLGFDRESIGFEKAGIMRSHQPVVCGDSNPPASILRQAALYQCQFLAINQDFSFACDENSWSWFGPEATLSNLPFPRLKLENVATSLMVVRHLQSQLPVDDMSICRGIGALSLPGRYECVTQPVNCVLDVAHNPESAKWLATQLQQDSIYAATAVIGMLADKQIVETIRPLVPIIKYWYIAALDVPRGGDGKQIRQELKALGVKNCYNFSSVKAAMQQALQDHYQQPLIVFGSFYTVAAAKELLTEIGVMV